MHPAPTSARPLPLLAPAPAGNTIGAAPAPSMWERARGVVANSAIGHAVEDTFPAVSDALHIRPKETVYSPTYQADRNQILAPQYLMPGNPTSKVGNVTKGFLRGAGQLTSANNLATAAVIAGTAGLAAPALAGMGTIGAVARMAAQGGRPGAAAVGAHGVYSDVRHAIARHQVGDTNGAMEELGAALPNAALTLPALAEPIRGLGEAAQQAGVGLINETIGARTKDFSRGASPGQGYFQAGLGPSASMGSIAAKAADARQATGAAIGDASKVFEANGGLIPLQQGSAAIMDGYNRTRAALTGPGGTGDTAALNHYVATWEPMLDAAKQRGGFLPTEYAAAKRNTAGNTTWSDPAQAGMRQMRQQTVGAMGGAMVDANPDLGDLNNRYQNLSVLADRAGDRALGGSMPLAGMLQKGMMTGLTAGAGALTHNPAIALAGGAAGAALDSVPVRTSVASGLYYGGKLLTGGVDGTEKALSAVGGRLGEFLPRFGAGSTSNVASDDLVGNTNSEGSAHSDNPFHSSNPLSAPYSFQNLTPEIIDPSAMSRSSLPLGPDGSGGLLRRPLGLLSAPGELPMPLDTGYRLRNLVPEIISPDAQSRSRFGIGTDGRGGQLVRPLAALPPSSLPDAPSASSQLLPSASIRNMFDGSTAAPLPMNTPQTTMTDVAPPALNGNPVSPALLPTYIRPQASALDTGSANATSQPGVADLLKYLREGN